jgi:hypothetical protein
VWATKEPWSEFFHRNQHIFSVPRFKWTAGGFEKHRKALGYAGQSRRIAIRCFSTRGKSPSTRIRCTDGCFAQSKKRHGIDLLRSPSALDALLNLLFWLPLEISQASWILAPTQLIPWFPFGAGSDAPASAFSRPLTVVFPDAHQCVVRLHDQGRTSTCLCYHSKRPGPD